MSLNTIQDGRRTVEALEMGGHFIIEHAEGLLLEDCNLVVVMLSDGLVNGAKVDLLSGDDGDVEQLRDLSHARCVLSDARVALDVLSEFTLNVAFQKN
jgi:hypothetical protein